MADTNRTATVLQSITILLLGIIAGLLIMGAYNYRHTDERLERMARNQEQITKDIEELRQLPKQVVGELQQTGQTARDTMRDLGKDLRGLLKGTANK